MNPARPLLLALALTTALPASADDAFDANLAIARQNLASEAGAAYDRKLGEAMAKLPLTAQATDECLARHPGDHDVQGYFHFTTPTRYTLVLVPAGRFATCLGKAFEGHAVPAPPKLPWFNHFTFQFQAPAVGEAR
jgi:hypothetical protein